MGSLWLVNLPEWLEDAGLPYRLYPGWEKRARSSGGYEEILAIGYHHDASSPGSSPEAIEAYQWDNADSRPIGAVYIRRDGSITIGAAGATNTMGKGGPLTTSAGTVPQDRGNEFMFAIEAANNGQGEAWPKVQMENYFKLCAVLCQRLWLAPNDCYSHWQYCEPSCPGRKVDPAGPTPDFSDVGGWSGAQTWSTPAFRNHVAAAMGTEPPPPPPPEEAEMLFIARDQANPNLYLVGNGVSSQRVRSNQMATLEANIGSGRWNHPTRATPITKMTEIPTLPVHQWQLLVGVETFESIKRP